MGGFVARVISKQRAAPVQRAAVQAAPAGPTVVEIQQGQIRRGRGRRATILTSSQGIDQDITLGRKSLLG